MVRKNKKPKFIGETVADYKEIRNGRWEREKRKVDSQLTVQSKAPCLQEGGGKRNNTLKVYHFLGYFDQLFNLEIFCTAKTLNDKNDTTKFAK